MTPLRAKDRLFIAVALPAAAVAAYLWLWRADASKKAAALETARDLLVAPESFAAEKASAEALLAAARDSLAREKEAPEPPKRLECRADASFAEREGAVLGIFREAGVAVLRADDAEGGPAGASLAAACGVAPRCRRYVLDGAYPAVRRALDLFVSRGAAAVPEKVEMRDGGGARWSVEIWE